MTKNDSLTRQREALKEELRRSKERAVLTIIFNTVSRLVQRITGYAEPLPIWYSGLVIALLSVLVGSLVSLLLGERPTPEMILVAAWGAAMGMLVMIQAEIGNRLLLNTLRRSTVDAIESPANLESLRRWLVATFDTRKQLVFSLFIALAVGLSAPFFWNQLKGGFPGFGPTVGVILIWFQAGQGWYYILPMLAWFVDLSQYEMKLYRANPSSSEAIDRLSDVLGYLVYSGAVVGALFTLGLIYFELLTPLISVLFLVLVTWGPLIIIFSGSQYALSLVIVKAKWKTLNELQAKIEKLQRQEEIPGETILSHLEKLMDYHDRIKQTRNSALDLRATLNFLNSLLLPLLAFLLANLDQVLAFFN